ncbi:MAG: hypothetical protein ACOC95_07135 [Planctomycetota bacterium]
MEWLACPNCGERVEIDDVDGRGASCPRCGTVMQAPPALPVAQAIPLGYAPAAPESKSLAITAFVLGLAALVPCLGPLCLLAATVMGIVVLATKRPGKAFAIAGPAAGWGMIALSMAWFLVPLSRARHMAGHATCAAHLRQIAMATELYVAHSGGTWPPDLGALVAAGHLTPAELECPARTPPGGVDYFYIQPPPLPPGTTSGLSTAPAAITTVLTCDYRANHTKGTPGRNVLFADGHVESLDEPDFQHLLARPENAAFAVALRAAEGP